MTKNFMTVVITLSVIAAGAAFTNIEAIADTLSPKVQQVIEYVDQNKHSLAEDVLSNMSSKEKDEFISYIEKNDAAVPPLYYIKMADYILKTDKDKAALWFYIGKVRAYEDVMMCKDKTSQAQLAIYQQFAPKTVKYLFSRNKDKSYMAALLQQVLDWDIAHENRYSPVWACYQSLTATTKTPEIVKNDEQKQKIIDNVRDELKESIIKYQKLD